MTRNDDDLKSLREAFATPRQAALSPEACPAPDRIWAAVRGELPPDEVREIVEHVAACASCAEDWRIAMAFEEESRVRQEEAVVHHFPARDRFRPWVAAAAAALVLTVGGIYVRQTQGPDAAPVYRGEESEIRAVVPPGGVLPRQACVLAWTPLPDAESYDLLVTTTELDTVADPKGLTTPKYQVPASALASLPPGAQLHWRVTAIYPEGGGRKQSKTFTTAVE
ncbi:MAG TPA: zf-HC2 domain-containing protein [Thermoanaerobaculia bacterium]|nr:zf-HC2 domain-containing protein [Thermoanaerobaculia bacterium]